MPRTSAAWHPSRYSSSSKVYQTFDDPRQQVVYELATTLTQPRVVPTGLFQRAQRLLGDAGIVDVTVLMGRFTALSLTLMAYDVPSNAVGLDQ
ncbi:hypothetical protein [Mycobacterium sp.]|uniref:hypothetical protein n=1 Tax=Mycobacterium sp. TaxID=1785 RepID=UPI0031CFB38D